MYSAGCDDDDDGSTTYSMKRQRFLFVFFLFSFIYFFCSNPFLFLTLLLLLPHGYVVGSIGAVNVKRKCNNIKIGLWEAVVKGTIVLITFPLYFLLSAIVCGLWVHCRIRSTEFACL